MSSATPPSASTLGDTGAHTLNSDSTASAHRARTLPDFLIGVREHFSGILRADGTFVTIAEPKPSWCLEADLILQRVSWHRPVPTAPLVGATPLEVETFLRAVMAKLDPTNRSSVEWVASDAQDASLVTVQLRSFVSAADFSAKYYMLRRNPGDESICMAQFYQLQAFRARFGGQFNLCYDMLKLVRSRNGVLRPGCLATRCARSHSVEAYHAFLRRTMALDDCVLPVTTPPPSAAPAALATHHHPSSWSTSSTASSKERTAHSRARSRSSSPRRVLRRGSPRRSRSRERRSVSPIQSRRADHRRRATGAEEDARSSSHSSNSRAPPADTPYAAREHFSATLSIDSAGHGVFEHMGREPPIVWTTERAVLVRRVVLDNPPTDMPRDSSPQELQHYLERIRDLFQRVNVLGDIDFLAVDAENASFVTIQLKGLHTSAIGFMAQVQKRLHARGLIDGSVHFNSVIEHQVRTKLRRLGLCGKFFSNLPDTHGRSRGCVPSAARACLPVRHDVAKFIHGMNEWKETDRQKLAAANTANATRAANATHGNASAPPVTACSSDASWAARSFQPPPFTPSATWDVPPGSSSSLPSSQLPPAVAAFYASAALLAPPPPPVPAALLFHVGTPTGPVVTADDTVRPAEDSYPDGAALFGVALEFEKLVTTPPHTPFVNALLQSDLDFLVDPDAEWWRSKEFLDPSSVPNGSMSLAHRFADATRVVKVLTREGVLSPELQLRLVYRHGPVHGYRMLLHFLSKHDRDCAMGRYKQLLQPRHQW